MTNKFDIGRNGYYADWISAPLAALAAVLWLGTPTNPVYFASSIIWGIATWTFLEYTIHRFMFHSPGHFTREHARHHVMPVDFIGVSPYGTLAIFAALGLGLPAVLGANIGVGFFVGLLTGYVAYIVLHDCYHHRRWLFTSLRNNHDWHHIRPRVNFGVTSPAWDHVFGTYQRPAAVTR